MIIVGGGILVKNTLFANNNKINTDNKIDKLDDTSIDSDIVESNENKEEGNEEEVVTSKLSDAPLNSVEYKNLADGEYLTSKGYTLKIENGVAYIDGLLIVNKTYSLPSSYGGELTSEVIQAFNLMRADALAMGLNIWIQSGYRSYSKQNNIYNNYVTWDGKEKADTYSARPGHSEHQTGLAFDLNTIDDSFTYTAEGKWVNNNCYLYGFIIRYPKGKDNITGYMHESWHLRYVGEDLAKKLYNDGNWLTLEEYFGINSSY